ncbi:MAG TPA: matrixin family metalloprotease [Candidatus Limnocylindrales bacterium]|nr:matrixin family metalloprotease [Candidatus Limnocylindrales bacterium]
MSRHRCHRRLSAPVLAVLLALALISGPVARAYVFDTTIPAAGGCPQPDRWSLSISAPLSRQWSTSLPLAPPTIVTSAASQTPAQLTEIEQAITASFSAWSGVTGTTFNATSYPGLIAPIARVTAQNACSNDTETNVDGINTICFNQASSAFTSGVLAFTRIITANAPGVSVGSSAPATFAGQILDADTLFRNDGQATFATPAGLATPQGVGAYDLESLLIHELGHWFGLDHSAVWRAIMFPYAPPPGQFLGSRPTAQVPDGPLSDDDRTAVRTLYPDPNDAAHTGEIQGRVLPANPFALATFPATSPGRYVTGIVGAHVVAVDSSTGAVFAGTLAGWTCNAATPPSQFDGSFDLSRLPVGRSYFIYAEPLDGLALPGDFGIALGDLCPSASASPCTTPAVNTNFNPRILPQ